MIMLFRSLALLALAIALNACAGFGKTEEAVEPPLAGARILLKNVRVFDSSTGAFSDPQDVSIEGSRIVAVGAALQAGPGARVIDAAGKYALPGLCDCHTHLAHLCGPGDGDPAEKLEAFLQNGITFVRDVGGPAALLAELKRRIQEGGLSGPEIFFTGPMLEGSPLTFASTNETLPGFTRAVDSVEDADRITAELAGCGASMIKTFGRMDREVYRHLAASAREKGLRVVHDPGGPLFHAVPIDAAIEMGAQSIEHAKAPWPAALKDGLKEEHDALIGSGGESMSCMFFLVKAAEQGVDGVSPERLDAIAELMRSRGIPLCPTLLVFDHMEEMALAQSKEKMKVEELPEPAKAMIRKMTAGMKTVSVHFTRELHARGVRLLAGHDGCDPEGLFKEMRALQECGIAPRDILLGATLYPAEWLGATDRLGSIAPGKQADLVIVPENPLEDIGRLAAVEFVIQGGRLVDAAPRIDKS